MGNSFQDQLLKTGLVNEKLAKKVRHEQRVSKQQKNGAKVSDESSITREERLAHEARNRELNRQQNEEKKKRENLAQVKQLIETNRLHLKEHIDDEPYYFTQGKLIKKLFFSEKIANQLTNGQLAIVKMDGKFEVIPANVARQIATRDPKSIVVFHDPSIDSLT